MNTREIDNHKVRRRIATIISGSLSGALVCLPLQPFDVIRTELQTLALINKNSLPTGVSQVLKNIWQRNGIGGFWRGSVPTVCRLSIGLGIQFFTLDLATDFVKYLRRGLDKDAINNVDLLLIGGFARSIAAAVTVPFTLIKTRFECSLLDNTYYNKGTFKTLKLIYHENGLRSLFKGTVPTIVTNAPYSGLYYMFYNILRTKLAQPYNVEQHSMASINFFAGIVAATAATLITQPSDMLRTYSQLQSPEFKFGQSFKFLLNEKGGKLLLSGMMPRVLKRSLQTALVWTLFEELQRCFSKKLKTFWLSDNVK